VEHETRAGTSISSERPTGAANSERGIKSMHVIVAVVFMSLGLYRIALNHNHTLIR